MVFKNNVSKNTSTSNLENEKAFVTQQESIPTILVEDTKVFDELENYGFVTATGDGVAEVFGLTGAQVSEFVAFVASPESTTEDVSDETFYGMVLNLEANNTTKIVIFGDNRNVVQNMMVCRTYSLVSVPTGANMVGRVVDSLGVAIDEFDAINYDENDLSLIEVKAPGILPRQSVSEPLLTGIKSIDSMIPIGKGQRELIIGDRQTGKTSIAIDIIINQKNVPFLANNSLVYCIYVASGQKRSSVVNTVYTLRSEGSMAYTTIVAATASDSAALQFLAPYTGCTLGEFFRDNGFHAVVIYDDLSKQATAYRQMSLLLRRPPTREAYPGDVFYLHSRLLERAAKMSNDFLGGSLTALPIIETLEGDLTAYIPTNVISITDGQIALDKTLINKGIMPAVNVGLSVSRVGSAAQFAGMKQVAGSLKLEIAQFREIETLLSFSDDVDATSRFTLDRGLRLTELLKQPRNNPLPFEMQLLLLYAGINGFLDVLPAAQVRPFETFLTGLMYSNIYRPFFNDIDAGLAIDVNVFDALLNEALFCFKTITK